MDIERSAQYAVRSAQGKTGDAEMVGGTWATNVIPAEAGISVTKGKTRHVDSTPQSFKIPDQVRDDEYI